MQYSLPIQLKCYEQLKEHVSALLSDYNTDDHHVVVLPITPELDNIFSEEMQSYGLTPRNGWLAFKKKNYFNKKSINPICHIDYTDSTGSEICNVSLIIPLENTNDAPMIWYTGEYDIVHVDMGSYSFATADWKNEGEVPTHKTDITQPTFCRVHIPHDTWSNEDGSYRSVVTVRFHGNPTFEEIAEKISNNS